MDPQDDPEARIRELERPLTDQARTSELGSPQPGGDAGPPIPPMPPAYTAPFPPAPFPLAPRKTSGGFSWWWMVAAVFVVGAVVLAAGIAVYSSKMFSRGGSVIGPPINRPSISRGATQSTTPGGRLSVSGINENRTIACDDSAVSVSGFSNTVVVTGHCASLTVSGGQNVVTVDASDTITASGFGNQVTYHSGSPQVGNFGESNTVQQG